jgi:hypothetical protein
MSVSDKQDGFLKLALKDSAENIFFRYRNENEALCDIIKGKDDSEGALGWYFPDYGKKVPMNTCVIRQKMAELPIETEYILTTG